MTSRHAAWTSMKQAYVDGIVFCVEIAIVRLVTSIQLYVRARDAICIKVLKKAKQLAALD